MRILYFILIFLNITINGYASTIDEKLYSYASGNVSFPYQEDYNFLLKMEKEGLAILKSNPESSSAWASLYLVYMGLMYTRAIDAGANDPLVTEYEKKMTDASKHLLSSTNSGELMDADFYHFIVVGLPDDLKLVAYRRMLKTPYYGETDNIRTEDYFQYSNTYFRLGEYDKAIEVLRKMLVEKNAGNTGINVASKYILEKIRKIEIKKSNVVKIVTKDVYTQAKPVAVQQAVEPKKVEAPKAIKETPASDNNTMLWWLLGGGALLLGLIVLMRRKQS